MPINPEMISVGRDLREWSQGDLANAIGVARTTISKFEMRALPCDREIPKIAARLNLHPDFFEQFESIHGLAGDFLYRKRAYVPARVKRRVQAEANLKKLQVKRLLEHVELEADLRFPLIQPEERNGNIEMIAADVRAAWRVKPGPIPNVTKLIEAAGGIVFVMDLGTDLIDGTNMRLPAFPPLLFLNENVAGERHRFNLAHELGHVVMHASVSLGDAEDEAYRFASELLMPRSQIKSDLRQLDLAAAARLKTFWGASMAAIIKRAHDLEVISNAKYRRLFQSLNAQDLRVVEPLPLPFEQPSAFENMKAVCRNACGLSEDDMTRLLFTDRLGPMEAVQETKLRIATPNLFEEESAEQ